MPYDENSLDVDDDRGSGDHDNGRYDDGDGDVGHSVLHCCCAG